MRFRDNISNKETFIESALIQGWCNVGVFSDLFQENVEIRGIQEIALLNALSHCEEVKQHLQTSQDTIT